MNRRRVVLLLCLATPAIVWTQSPPSSTFGLSFTRTDYEVSGVNAAAVAVADFNADGRPDIAVGNALTPAASVLLGNGNGTFQPRADYFQLPGQQLAVGDFNGDGRSDIASANFWAYKAYVGLANTDGTFGPTQVEVDLPGTPLAIATGDFNHDGKLDMVVACRFSETLSLLLGNGDGTFQPRTDYPIGGGNIIPISMAVGDFNEDGNLDAVVASLGTYFYNALSILLGNGDGTFLPNYGVMPANPYPSAVASGDLNGDGHLDLIVSSQGSEISTLLGNGDGTFHPRIDVATLPPAGEWVNHIVVGDLNGDGHPDVVFTNWNANLVSVLPGNGDGTFANQVDFATGLHPMYAAMADLNGDGRMDLVVSNGDGKSVSVFGNFPSDTEPPVIRVPAAIVLEATGPSGAVANWPAPTAADETDGTVPVICSPEPGSMLPMGVNTVTCHAADAAGNTATASFTVTVHDTTPPTITISTPVAGTVVVHQAISAAYSCADAGSGVASCVGTAANGSAIDTVSSGSKTFTVTARDQAGNESTRSVAYSVVYNIDVLYDQGKARNSGSTIPIKIRLVDSAGVNVSAPGITVEAVEISLLSPVAMGPVEDSGNANPDENFRYADDSYIFNLKTTGLGTGTYLLYFRCGADPTVHTVQFQIK